MPFTAETSMKLTHTREVFTENSYIKFHKNLTDSFVTDSKSWKHRLSPHKVLFFFIHEECQKTNLQQAPHRLVHIFKMPYSICTISLKYTLVNKKKTNTANRRYMSGSDK